MEEKHQLRIDLALIKQMFQLMGYKVWKFIHNANS